MFSRIWTKKSTNDCSGSIDTLRQVLRHADAVVIGAGSGLSTSAGFTYDGERFEEYFSDFAAKYGIRDMYLAAFIHILRRKNIGLTGAAIFISIAIWMLQSRSTMTF